MGEVAFVLMIAFAPVAVMIYIYYRFLRTLRDALRAVSARNRAMQPDLVWLNFIPLFNLVWMFVTVIKLRDSARAEFAFRGLRMKEDMGFGTGMTFAVTSVLAEIYIPPEQFLNDRAYLALTVVSWIVGLANFICWLVYWEEVSRLKGLLLTAAPVLGSPASPGSLPGYQPRSWEMPPEEPSAAPSGAPQGGRWLSGQPEGAMQPGPWLGTRSPQDQLAVSAGHWSSASPASSQTSCPSCGAVNRSEADRCWSCGGACNPA